MDQNATTGATGTGGSALGGPLVTPVPLTVKDLAAEVGVDSDPLIQE